MRPNGKLFWNGQNAALPMLVPKGRVYRGMSFSIANKGAKFGLGLTINEDKSIDSLDKKIARLEEAIAGRMPYPTSTSDGTEENSFSN